MSKVKQNRISQWNRMKQEQSTNKDDFQRST